MITVMLVIRRRHRAGGGASLAGSAVDVIINVVSIVVVVVLLLEVHGVGLERGGGGRGDGGQFGEEGFEAAHGWSNSHVVIFLRD